MQKSINYITKLSLGSLALLAVLTFCPIYHYTAEATTEVSVDDQTTVDGTVTVYPIISLAIDGNIDVEVTPKSGGTFNQSSTRLVVSTNVPKGYRVLLNGVDGDTLVSKDGIEVPPISAKGEFTANTWGVYLGQDNPTEADFVPVTTVAQELQSSNQAGEADEYQLAFGTKVDTSLPAGTYSRQVVISAITHPVALSHLNSVQYMQQMTTDICARSEVGDTAQLIDSRDDNIYWVGKLADGKCWMQQNLDLDITVSNGNAATTNAAGETVLLTNENTDITTTNWNSSTGLAPQKAMTVVPTTGYSNSDSTYSWNPGKIISVNPTQSNDCIGNANGSTLTAGVYLSQLATVCPKYFQSVSGMTAGFQATTTSSINDNEYDAHYLIGNWYSWGAATAGTANKITTADITASSSICPKNWRLPSTTEIQKMLDEYGINSSTSYDSNAVVQVATDPIYYVRAGLIDVVNASLRAPGFYGLYWSSTASSNKNAYETNISPSNIRLKNSNPRQYGDSVRCIAE